MPYWGAAGKGNGERARRRCPLCSWSAHIGTLESARSTAAVRVSPIARSWVQVRKGSLDARGMVHDPQLPGRLIKNPHQTLTGITQDDPTEGKDKDSI